jgi:hypothetical protein
VFLIIIFLSIINNQFDNLKRNLCHFNYIHIFIIHFNFKFLYVFDAKPAKLLVLSLIQVNIACVLPVYLK